MRAVYVLFCTWPRPCVCFCSLFYIICIFTFFFSALRRRDLRGAARVAGASIRSRARFDLVIVVVDIGLYTFGVLVLVVVCVVVDGSTD